MASVSCSPLEIINYEDAEAGHGHMMSGVPGEMVEGSFYWKVSALLFALIFTEKKAFLKSLIKKRKN